MKSQNPMSVRPFITAILQAYKLGGFYEWYYCVDQNIRELQVSNYISISLQKKNIVYKKKTRIFRISFLKQILIFNQYIVWSIYFCFQSSKSPSWGNPCRFEVVLVKALSFPIRCIGWTTCGFLGKQYMLAFLLGASLSLWYVSFSRLG